MANDRFFDIDRNIWYRQTRRAPLAPVQHIKYIDLDPKGLHRVVCRTVPFGPVPVRLSREQQQLLDDALTPHAFSPNFQRSIEDALSRYRGLRAKHTYTSDDIRAYARSCISSARACIGKVKRHPRGYWYNATIVAMLEHYIAECEHDIADVTRPRSRPRDDAAAVLGAGVIEALVGAKLSSDRAVTIEVLRCVRQFAAQSNGERPLSRARTYAFAKNAICRHLARGLPARASSR